jgi:hypothetical protein
MSKIIREFERRVVRKTIQTLLGAGCDLMIDYQGEEPDFPVTGSNERFIDEMFACDEATLRVVWRRKVSSTGTHIHTGYIRFIYGSAGWDVIQDYSTNLKTPLKPVLEFCRKYED